MASRAHNDAPGRAARSRVAVWGMAAFLLALPAMAMQFTSEVNWDETDFIVMGVMLATACGTYELAVRMSDSAIYRAGFGFSIAAGFLLVWINLAVGIIGTEDNPANLLYVGVLAVAICGAFVARLRAQGMARAMIATATAQAVVGVAALFGRLGVGDPNWPHDVVGVTVIFVGLWLTAALLFRKAGDA
jgi:hypothetical protein